MLNLVISSPFFTAPWSVPEAFEDDRLRSGAENLSVVFFCCSLDHVHEHVSEYSPSISWICDLETFPS